jgi:translocation and assembly module TamB
MRFFRSPRSSGSNGDPLDGRIRWVPWLVGSLACLGGLVVFVAVAAVVLLHSLDRPWLKRRLQALVRASSGVEFDYQTARVALLSGAEIAGLVVQSPGEVRASAPDLIRVGRVDAHWSLRSLLLGPGPLIERLTLSSVALTVVVDEHGRTSFDALSSGSQSAPGPTVPLSHQASKWLGTAPPVGQLDVDRLTLTLLRTEHGAVSDRIELGGVSVTLALRSAEPAVRGWRAIAGLGSPATPL